MLAAALSITEFGEEGEHRLAVLLGADRVHVVLAGEPPHLGVAHGCREWFGRSIQSHLRRD